MRHLAKTGGILVGIGLALFLAIYLLTGGQPLERVVGQAKDRDKAVAKQETFSAAEVSQLDLDVSLANVTIIGADQDQVTIDYTDSRQIQYAIKNDGGRLTVSNKSSNRYNFMVYIDIEMIAELFQSANSSKRDITIKLPREQLKELKANADTGNLTIEDLVVKGDADLSTDLGQVTVTGTDFQGNVSGDLESGSGKFSEVTAQSMELKTSLGNLDLTAVRLADSLTADLDSGSINLDRLDAGKSIQISTDLGSVNGSLVGRMSDYNIVSRVDLGSNNLPTNTTGGSKSLIVDTDSGSIKLDFTEDSGS